MCDGDDFPFCQSAKRSRNNRFPCRNVLLKAAESGTLTPEMVDKQTSGMPSTPEAASSQMSPARLARKVPWLHFFAETVVRLNLILQG